MNETFFCSRRLALALAGSPLVLQVQSEFFYNLWPRGDFLGASALPVL